MKRVFSAGGIVLKNDTILMLQKMNGDWVLPKGRIEKDESELDAAIREVEEETGIVAKSLKKIGMINYSYKNIWYGGEMIDKDVCWFLMEEITGNLKPLREEGFIDVKYLPLSDFEKLARYEDEKRMIRKAIELR
jgi:8-oxo-dGTP pyrophosphatase MutT (NUDIX family)